MFDEQYKKELENKVDKYAHSTDRRLATRAGLAGICIAALLPIMTQTNIDNPLKIAVVLYAIDLPILILSFLVGGVYRDDLNTTDKLSILNVTTQLKLSDLGQALQIIGEIIVIISVGITVLHINLLAAKAYTISIIIMVVIFIIAAIINIAPITKHY